MMQLVTHYLVLLADWLQPYLHEICMAQVATLLVVYCSDIDRALRRRLKPYPFVVRVTGFVLLNAFGYGFITLSGGGLLAQLYLQIGGSLRVPVLLLVFIAIGVLAERRNHI